MDLRAPLLLGLLALPLAAPPADGANVSCAYDEAVDYVLGNLLIHYVTHDCTYYDVNLHADVTDRLERYDAYREDPLDASRTPAYVFTYYTHTVERHYLADGRLTTEDWTHLATEQSRVRHGYFEETEAGEPTRCHGAFEAIPGIIPGRVSVPRTPDYPNCAPGVLA